MEEQKRNDKAGEQRIFRERRERRESRNWKVITSQDAKEVIRTGD